MLFGISDKPQIIRPEELQLNIGSLQPGFGYTISKDKLDVDGNNCKDFAIGYPKANRVILLRSKEVVILEDLDDAIKIDDHKPIDPPTDPIDPGKFIQLVEKVKVKKLSNSSY